MTVGGLLGLRLFVSAEQGLGDEVLFGSLLPDIARDLGPGGRLGIGVEPRLVPLFQRSFPEAAVVAHRTRTVDGRIVRDFPDLDPSAFDRWALLGDFLGHKRSRISDFPAENTFLKPDPARVAHWRDALARFGGKPKVGLLWKSLKQNAVRDRYFSPFQQWQTVLGADNVSFINLQYGDSAAEMAQAKAEGHVINTPEGIDLKMDLDDLAALCSAMDLVLGPPNATTNIAAACGVKTWMLSTPGAWTKLGQANMPWYPSVHMFVPPSLDDWGPAMAEIRAALAAEFA